MQRTRPKTVYTLSLGTMARTRVGITRQFLWRRFRFEERYFSNFRREAPAYYQDLVSGSPQGARPSGFDDEVRWLSGTENNRRSRLILGRGGTLTPTRLSHLHSALFPMGARHAHSSYIGHQAKHRNSHESQLPLLSDRLLCPNRESFVATVAGGKATLTPTFDGGKRVITPADNFRHR